MFDLGSLWKSTDCTGSLTYDDLRKFVDEMKHEYADAGKQELEWMRMQEQNARTIASAFEIPPQESLTYEQLLEREHRPFPYLPEDATANRVENAIQSLIDERPVVFTTSKCAYTWRVTVRTYSWLRWHRHVAKAYPLSARKLRKCHLRKRTRRLQRERKRYFDHV